uniref:Uncharacterized protein n=1 Tax=Leersia perrieri TaxID=77586 RepID=A0A0D9WRL1_9ORYZ
MQDLAEEFVMLRITLLQEGWVHELTSGDKRCMGSYMGPVTDTTSLTSVSMAIMEAEKILRKPVLKEKHQPGGSLVQFVAPSPPLFERGQSSRGLKGRRQTEGLAGQRRKSTRQAD